MNTIERYIFRRSLSLFAFNLMIVSAIVWVTHALSRVNVISDSAASVFAFLKIASYSIPASILEVSAFAIVIGLAQTLSTMNTDSELAVVNSAGAGRITTTKPAMALAMIAAIGIFVLDTTIVPSGGRATREVISKARGDLLTTVLQAGAFNKIEQNLYIQIAERGAGGLLSGIFVADQRDKKAELLYYAKEGLVVRNGEQSILALKDGELHRRSPEGDISVVRFTTYAFNLESMSSNTGKGISYLPRDRPLDFVLNPPKDDGFLRQSPGIYRAEAARRLTSWLHPLIFALFAVAIAGNPVSHRQARIPPLLSALVVALVLRWIMLAVDARAIDSAVFRTAQIVFPAIALAAAVFAVVNANALGKGGAWLGKAIGGDVFGKARWLGAGREWIAKYFAT